MGFALWIYFFTVIANIQELLSIAFASLLLTVIVMFVIGGINKIDRTFKEFGKYYWNLFRRLLIALAIVSGVVIFFPSEEDSRNILAAYAAQHVGEMEEVQDVGSKSLKAMNKMLDEYLQSE